MVASHPSTLVGPEVRGELGSLPGLNRVRVRVTVWVRVIGRVIGSW